MCDFRTTSGPDLGGSAPIAILGLWAALLVWAGCTGAQTTDDTGYARLAQSAWQISRIQEDLTFLQVGRTSAPDDNAGYADGIAYVAAQMDGLQPALATSYAVRYHMPPEGDTPAKTGSNILALVAGADPALRSELIIVAADLGGIESHQSLAALMEIARSYASDATRGYMPSRTIMVAAFSGCADACSGLRAYLRMPLWPADKTRAVVFLAPIDPAALADALGPLAEVLHVVELQPDAGAEDQAQEVLWMATAADQVLRRLAAGSE